MSYIDDLTDNRDLPKWFLSITWDNDEESIGGYDLLSDEEFDKLPSYVCVDEKSTLVLDYLSTQYQCLVISVDEVEDEDEIEELQEDYQKMKSPKTPPKNQSSSCGCC